MTSDLVALLLRHSRETADLLEESDNRERSIVEHYDRGFRELQNQRIEALREARDTHCADRNAMLQRHIADLEELKNG